MNLPFVYVRSTPKDHGLENLIEGELRPGMKVVVVEDLISTGGSSLKAVEAIRRDGCEVIGMVAAYTYGFPVAEKGFQGCQGAFGDADQLRGCDGSGTAYGLYRGRRCGDSE